MTATEEAKLLHAVERHLFQDELRRLKTRQGAFDAAMYHLDHPVPGTDFYLKPSDHGRGAADIRRNCESSLDTQPLWRKMWNRRRLELKPRHRAVLDALMLDMRPQIAARLSRTSKYLVYECLQKIFKKHFAQCYQAYHQHLAHTKSDAF